MGSLSGDRFAFDGHKKRLASLRSMVLLFLTGARSALLLREARCFLDTTRDLDV